MRRSADTKSGRRCGEGILCRWLAGLTEALAEHFSSHIDCVNQNDGESCPGADKCRETRGKPLNKYQSGGQSEDEICGGCALFATKPEATPKHLAEFVNVALGLAEIERGGGRFAYPDALGPVEWASLSGLTRGRDRADGLKADRDRKEQRRKKKERDHRS